MANCFLNRLHSESYTTYSVTIGYLLPSHNHLSASAALFSFFNRVATGGLEQFWDESPLIKVRAGIRQLGIPVTCLRQPTINAQRQQSKLQNIFTEAYG